jgi:hypothetical protein
MARGEVTGRKPAVSADKVERASGPPIPNKINATAHAEPKTKLAAKTPPISGPPIQPMAYSIRTFCELHNISVDTYFRMQRRGEGPVTMKVGGRTLISQEAAAAWRRAREAAAQEARRERELAAQDARHQGATQAAEQKSAT